jgi:hypothetical protein
VNARECASVHLIVVAITSRPGSAKAKIYAIIIPVVPWICANCGESQAAICRDFTKSGLLQFAPGQINERLHNIWVRRERGAKAQEIRRFNKPRSISVGLEGP